MKVRRVQGELNRMSVRSTKYCGDAIPVQLLRITGEEWLTHIFLEGIINFC
jgi:hypothetical protein